MANYTSILSVPDGRCSLCSPACVCWGEGRPRPRTISVSSRPRLAWPGAGGTFVRQTGFGTSRWSSLLQNSPRLMEWDTTVTTRPSKAPLNGPAVLPCVIYGSEGWPAPATSSLYLMPLICLVGKYFCCFYISRVGLFILFSINSYCSLTINNKVVSCGLISGW